MRVTVKPRFSWRAVILVPVVCILCSCRVSDREVTVVVTEVSGAEYRLQTPVTTVLKLDPVTTNRGGATALEIDLINIARVARQGNRKVSTVELRGGDRVAGKVGGFLEGKGPDGPKAVPWTDVLNATPQWSGAEPAYLPPGGTWCRVHGDGIEPLEIRGLKVEQGWIVRHGTHAYRRDTKATDILPFTVPRDRVIRSEWDIPIWTLKAITVFTGKQGITVDIGGGEEIRLEGMFGSDLRRYQGDAFLLGSDATGRWRLSLLKMRSAVKRVATELQATQHQPAVVNVDLFGQQPPRGEKGLVVEPIGTLTDWDGETYPVVDTWFEQMKLRISGSDEEQESREVNPASVVEIRVFESPWTLYDERRSMPQWLDAELTLADGSRLAGALHDRFGYLSCIGPGEIIVHFPSYAIRRLQLEPR